MTYRSNYSGIILVKSQKKIVKKIKEQISRNKSAKKNSKSRLCGLLFISQLSGTFSVVKCSFYNLSNGMWYVEDVNGDVFPLLQGVRDQVNLQRVGYADDKYNLVKKL